MILNGWPRPRSRGPQIAGGRALFKKRGLPTARDSFDLKKKRGVVCPRKDFRKKGRAINDVQCASLKKYVKWTTFN